MVGLGFLLLVSIVASGVISYLGAQVKSVVGIEPLSAASINYGVQTLVAYVVSWSSSKCSPMLASHGATWRSARWSRPFCSWWAAGGLQLFFTVTQPGAKLGEAAASLAAIFVWVYYSAMIVLLGAEATQVYASRRGRGARPKKRAVRVVERIERGWNTAT